MPNPWPDFGQILDFDIATGQALAGLLTVILWFAAGLMLLYLFWQWRRCSAIREFYHDLINSVPEDRFLERRKRLRQDAAEAGYWGQLWLDYDDTLVLAATGDQLHRTADAREYFNDSTLNAPLNRNNLVGALPIMLMLGGIIGSFSVFLIFGEIAFAFVPVFWGVLSAAAIYLVTQFLRRLANEEVVEIQTQIDSMCTRTTSEQVLAAISDHSREGAAALKDMLGVIEQQMDMILARTRQAVRFEHNKSLDQIVTPGIERLVDDLRKKSEVVLSELKESYLREANDIHKTQSVMLSESIQKMSDDTEQMGLEIANFFVQVEQQLKSIDQVAQKRLEGLEKQLKEVVAKSESTLGKNIKSIAADNQSRIESVNTVLAEQLDAIRAGDDTFKKQIAEEMRQISSAQTALAARVDALMARQDDDFQALQAIVRTVVAALKGAAPPAQPEAVQSGTREYR